MTVEGVPDNRLCDSVDCFCRSATCPRRNRAAQVPTAPSTVTATSPSAAEPVAARCALVTQLAMPFPIAPSGMWLPAHALAFYSVLHSSEMRCCLVFNCRVRSSPTSKHRCVSVCAWLIPLVQGTPKPPPCNHTDWGAKAFCSLVWAVLRAQGRHDILALEGPHLLCDCQPRE